MQLKYIVVVTSLMLLPACSLLQTVFPDGTDGPPAPVDSPPVKPPASVSTPSHFGKPESYLDIAQRYQLSPSRDFIAIVIQWQERLRPFLHNSRGLARLTGVPPVDPLAGLKDDLGFGVDQVGFFGLTVADRIERHTGLALVNATQTMTKALSRGDEKEATVAAARVHALLHTFMSYKPQP